MRRNTAPNRPPIVRHHSRPHKLIWEKMITKKRITKLMIMKETKIKTSSLSLTLKPGNKF